MSELDRFENDLNGYGKRLNCVEATQARHDAQVGFAQNSIGEIKAEVKDLSKKVDFNNKELTTKIDNNNGFLHDKINDTNRKIALYVGAAFGISTALTLCIQLIAIYKGVR